MTPAAQSRVPGRVGRGTALERALKPQVGARKYSAAAQNPSLLRAVSILISSPGGRRRGQSSRGDLGGGRGSQSLHPPWKFSQRVVVKARVVRNRGLSGRGTVRDHVNYLERDGVDEQGGKGRSFGIEDTLSEADIDAFIGRSAQDRHHFRFIVSPEHAGELDLPLFARELMLKAEADLGTALDWVAVAHHNTDNPHVHILVRGVDQRGADLVIGRDYISRGLRGRGQEIATEHLGPRREVDIEREAAAELRADRATGLDRALVADVEQGGGLIDVRPPQAPEVGFRERRRVEKITRLHHLETINLADEIKPGRWQIDPKLLETLTQRARRTVLVTELTRQVGQGYAFNDIKTYDKTAPDAPIIEGEIIARGKVDEDAEYGYVLLGSHTGATAGTVYRIALSAFTERSQAPLKGGQVAQVSVYERPAVTRADENLIAQARQDAGVYSAERHTQRLEALKRQGRTPIEDIASYIDHHVKRIEAHERRGLVERVEPGMWRIPEGLTESLVQYSQTMRDGGSFVRITPVSSFTLDAQVHATGPTWLDTRLVQGAHLPRPAADTLSAERRLRAALLLRVEELKRRGISVANRALVSEEIEALYAGEIHRTADRLRLTYGEHLPLNQVRAGGVDLARRIEGTVAEVAELASGPHAVLVTPKGFTLIPASYRVSEYLGRQMSVTLGSESAQDPTRPRAVQMRIRFADLERERARDLGRGR